MFEAAKDRLAATRQAKVENDLAMLNLMADLRYPVSQDGSVLDMTYFSPLIAWHLVRCGWRPDPKLRKIKPRNVIAKGVIKGAVEWVPVDAPDDPLANLANMTTAEVNALPPIQKAEAMRRMGGPEMPDLRTNPGWKVQTNIKIQNAPDTSDGIAWSGRQGDQ